MRWCTRPAARSLSYREGVRIGVVTFPGTLDDIDAARAVKYAGGEAVPLWHADHDLQNVDAVVLPGGFSYGDYLRCGAIARFAPVMQEITDAAEAGMPVLGICNGFQVLLEAGLLPGALMRNAGLKFLCKPVGLSVATTDSPFTSGYRKDQEITFPIAHHDGNYTADAELLKRLAGEDRVAFRYTDNPNGSAGDIAGVLSENRRVLGLMPHPERAIDPLQGGTDGVALFSALVSALESA